MKRIYRSDKDKMMAGLCGGAGEMLDVDPTLIRLCAIAICLITGIVPVVVCYIVGWAIVPPHHRLPDLRFDPGRQGVIDLHPRNLLGCHAGELGETVRRTPGILNV